MKILGLALLLAGPAVAAPRTFGTPEQAALHAAAKQMKVHPRIVARLGTKVTARHLQAAIAEPLRRPDSRFETHFVNTRERQGAVSPYPNDAFASVAVTVENTGKGWVGHPGKNPVVIQLDKWVKSAPASGAVAR